MDERRASDLFVECLEAEGVRHVFGIPGEETLDLNESLERSNDSLRSSVSSPGMPNTYLTPSASRHSTKRSDALRSLIPQLLSRPRVELTYAIGTADA